MDEPICWLINKLMVGFNHQIQYKHFLGLFNPTVVVVHISPNAGLK